MTAAASTLASAHVGTPATVLRTEWVSWPRADGSVPLRLHIVVPAGPPPAAGYPVLYMLDGDAVAAHLRQAGLAAPVLVVAVGYDAQGDALKGARAYDYTPLWQGERHADPRAPQWLNGGADALVADIAGPIAAWVAARFPVDRRRQSLYGHSYGGLCVLHAAASPVDVFAGFIAASPSLWWRDGAVETTLCAQQVMPRQVLMMVGEREAWFARPVGQDGTPDSRQGGQATWPAAQRLAQALTPRPGWRVEFRAIAGATHHTMLASSIAPALIFAYAARPLGSAASSQGEQEIASS